ncbi:uncharacterized protein LOC117917583 isoform X3 [Vitis riparia]|uniref:uncharacterized protein LOC117917583 isoform X3 n=1 Tax=Vitis riparia TaxID=96939 RepID=UPI00053F5534|nr:uncharacterized protein LOC117917583 isoform X3 [Vitis riparia]|eukprot:XP_010646426.1 PREDICTED: uncharacterized protein LOC100248648 isoform X3 [Vitis vinifera]
MDGYLHYVKTLRSQINDVEDQAAKISVEEQMRITAIHTLETDLVSAKSQTGRLKEETNQMVKEKNRICSQILAKQKRIATLESDSSTLTQTLELIQQERVSLSAKVIEKSTYYNKVAEAINGKLQEQQDWINTHKLTIEAGDCSLNFMQVKVKIDEQTGDTEGNFSIEDHLIIDSQMKESIEQEKCQINNFKSELRAMDMKNMEEEYNALLSDKAGEAEYLHSLQGQIEKLKGLSHKIKCACGTEYKVGLELCV